MVVQRSLFSLIEALHTGMQANVAMSGSVSTDFSESNGVKKGCVLAPTVFSLYLAAVLEVVFKDTRRSMHLNKERNRLKAKSETSIKIVREMLYADDSALEICNLGLINSQEQLAISASKSTSRRQSVFISHQSSNYQHHYQKISAMVHSH